MGTLFPWQQVCLEAIWRSGCKSFITVLKSLDFNICSNILHDEPKLNDPINNANDIIDKPIANKLIIINTILITI